MDMHWVAGGVVLLILAAVSAYREALRNEPIGDFSKIHGDFPLVEEVE